MAKLTQQELESRLWGAANILIKALPIPNEVVRDAEWIKNY